jgi:predicted HicB family RNase H-like nuclease
MNMYFCAHYTCTCGFERAIIEAERRLHNMDDQRKKRNQYEFDKRKYDHLHLQVPKGRKAVIQAASVAVGESLNGYVSKAIDERITRQEATGGVVEGDPDTREGTAQ